MAANPTSRRALRYHQRRRARTIKVLTLLVLLVAVAATATGITLSRRESGKERFIRRAAAVCDANAADIDEAASGLTAESTPEDIGAFLKDDYVPIIRDRIKKLRALGFPGGDREKLEKIYDDTDKVLTDIEADPAAFASQGNPFGDIDTRFDAYGVTECGSRTGASSGSASTG